MRRVVFKSVLDAISRMAGWGSLDEIDNIRRGKIIEYVNIRIREAWEWDWWAELMRVEYRAYRESWDSTRPYMAGSEVYYPEDNSYYRCLLGNIGLSPDVNDAHWELIELQDKYIGYEQPGETFIGHVRHCYTRSPRTSLYPGLIVHGFSENGVQLPTSAPSQAWIEFRIRCAEFSNNEHDPAHSYEVGDVIYDPNTGDCYKAMISPAGEYWARIDFPYIFKNFAVRAVSSDLLRDDGQEEKSYPEESRAYDYLMDLQDIEMSQQGQYSTIAVSSY